MANTVQPWVDPGNALTTESDNAILQEMLAGLGNLSTAIQSSGGLPFLGLDRTGSWKFGQGATEPEAGSYWAMDLPTAKFGYIAWVDGKPAGKVMVSILERRPSVHELDAALPWKDQVSIELLCVSGEDKDQRVLYETSSHGGKKAFMDYASIAKHHVKYVDPAKPIAIVQLATSSYPHPQYGKTIEPVFKICGWASTGILRVDDSEPGSNGQQAKAAAQATPVNDRRDVDPTPEPTPTGRRRRQVGNAPF